MNDTIPSPANDRDTGTRKLVSPVLAQDGNGQPACDFNKGAKA